MPSQYKNEIKNPTDPIFLIGIDCIITEIKHEILLGIFSTLSMLINKRGEEAQEKNKMKGTPLSSSFKLPWG